MAFLTFLSLLALVRCSIAGYAVQDDYTPDNFFSMFDFFTDADPTNGFVQYVSQSDAESANMVSTGSGIFMGVDNVTQNAANGRQSVRITSKNSYDSGLVILDLEHMPGGICGTWPAFWMVGPDWPSGGEIDIVEGVNDQTYNAMTLHTGPDCSISSSSGFTGSVETSDCYVEAEDQSANAGCAIEDSSSLSYGTGFNENGGGVYATEWDSESISIYFFPRGSIPSDITNGSPDPTGWGLPQAKFQGACDIAESFKDLQIVFDTTFCGDWAGNAWDSSSCASKADTCDSFVQNNPSAFTDAYWSINSLKVYQDNGDTEPTASSTSVADILPSSIGVPAVVSSILESILSDLTPTTFAISTKAASFFPVAESSATPSSSETPASFAPTPTASVPFPAGNASRPAFPSGSGLVGTAPFGLGNGTAGIGPTGTGASRGFRTVTVTAIATVFPSPTPSITLEGEVVKVKEAATTAASSTTSTTPEESSTTATAAASSAAATTYDGPLMEEWFPSESLGETGGIPYPAGDTVPSSRRRFLARHLASHKRHGHSH